MIVYQVVLDTNVLVAALRSRRGASFRVTHNTRHFAGVEQFGIRVVTPREFLTIIGERP
jgi:hypothetical protein